VNTCWRTKPETLDGCGRFIARIAELSRLIPDPLELLLEALDRTLFADESRIVKVVAIGFSSESPWSKAPELMTDFAAITEPLSALDQEVSAVKNLALEQIGPSTRFATREIARLLSSVRHFASSSSTSREAPNFLKVRAADSKSHPFTGRFHVPLVR